MKVLGPDQDSQPGHLGNGLGDARESDIEGLWDLTAGLPQDWGSRLGSWRAQTKPCVHQAQARTVLWWKRLLVITPGHGASAGLPGRARPCGPSAPWLCALGLGNLCEAPPPLTSSGKGVISASQNPFHEGLETEPGTPQPQSDGAPAGALTSQCPGSGGASPGWGPPRAIYGPLGAGSNREESWDPAPIRSLVHGPALVASPAL